MQPANTNLVVQIEDYSNPEQREQDPLILRWGFNPSQREKLVPAIETGMSIVPFAKFFPIKRFNAPQENHSIDWTQDKEHLATVSAESAQTRIEESLAGKSAQEVPDWGFRVGFYGETDGSKMEVISQTLLPTLSAIREICSEFELQNPIGEFCPGSDDLDYGNRETCQACWRLWLKSEALKVYIDYIVREGMEVQEFNPRSKSTGYRVVKPSHDDFNTALGIVMTAFQVGTVALQNQWRMIAEEVDKGTRSQVMPYEDGYRKDLHANKPEDRQVAMVNRIVEGVGGGNNNQQQNVSNEIQLQTLKLLQEMRADVNNLKATQPLQLPK